MKWSNVRLIFARELRDQLRDRRTLLTILALPLLLYPLLGMTYLQMAQFLKESPTRICILGTDHLPATPSLLDDSGKLFAEQLFPKEKQSLLELTINPQLPAGVSREQLPSHARETIESGEQEVIVYFPQNFADQLKNFREAVARYRTEDISLEDMEKVTVPAPIIYINTASDKSQLGFQRTENILREWRQSIVNASFLESRIPAQASTPFQLEQVDVARTASKQAAIWSKILPFFVLVWALAGAFYPAVDLCAGEKERGTLETLLCSPADRREIVWGKMLTVMVFSVITALLNLLSLCVTGVLIFSRLSQMATIPMQIGIPPLHAIGWLMLALIPIAALFSALALAVAAFARSTKEGQYYLMPLLLICMPLMTLSMLPSVELELGTSLIPITGMVLLLRTLVEQQYLVAIQFAVPVLGVTAMCCWLASRWAIAQFNNESVLFRESERADLRLWLRHLVHMRGDTPTAGMAVCCGLLLLVLNFFAHFLFPEGTNSWTDMVISTLGLQLGLLLTPTLLFAYFLTRRPGQTFLVEAMPPVSCLLAILLAATLHPLVIQLGALIQWIYPMNSGTMEALEPVLKLLSETPWPYVVLVIAVVPAICEELVFRGFLLSGFRQLGNTWSAIILSSLFFAIVHGILQQSLNACILGIVIGYIAVKSRSILPCILYHLTHNTISVLHSRLDPGTDSGGGLADWIFLLDAQQQYQYQPTVLLVGSCIAACILLYYIRLPLHLSPAEALRKATQDSLDHA